MDHGLLIIFILHAGATFFMAGVIWFTQIIHYRLFQLIDAHTIPDYMRRDIPWTAKVAAPGMIVEAATGLLLLLNPLPGMDTRLLAVGFFLIAALWLSRAFVQVPCFLRLTQGYRPRTLKYLLHSNWFCVWLWSLRCVLVGKLAMQIVP